MTPIKFCDKHSCDKVYILDRKRWYCKLCQNEYQKTWSKSTENRAKNALRQKKYAKTHPDKTKSYKKKWAKNNRIKENLRINKWVKNNNPKYYKKYCSELRDSYVKRQLKTTGIEKTTPEMIEEKRLTLKITRQIKTIKTKLNQKL